MGAVTFAIAAATAALPFQITFTDGRCQKCSAQMLGDIQFLDDTVLWAQGYTPPGEQVGVGEWTLLSSRDGGRSWHELRDSWSHNSETRAFFADRRDAWTEVPNSLRLGALPYYAITSDGGRRWRPLTLQATMLSESFIGVAGRGRHSRTINMRGKALFL